MEQGSRSKRRGVVISSTKFYQYLDALELEQEQYHIAAHLMIYVTPLLHRISQGIPEFTDHGIIHATNVLRYVRDITREYPAGFSNDERFILALASVLHDLGCISGREKHNEKTVRILEKSQFNFLAAAVGDLNFRALKLVILAHSRKVDLNKLGRDPSAEISLKKMASIFRLADACDVSGSRVKRLVLEILLEEKRLPPKSEEIWKAHLQVENIIVTGTDIQPQVYDLKLADYCIKSLDEEIESINKTLSKIGLPTFSLTPNLVDAAIREDN